MYSVEVPVRVGSDSYVHLTVVMCVI